MRTSVLSVAAIFIMFGFLCVVSSSAQVSPDRMLEVRLVAADKGPGGQSTGMSDILPFLRKNFRFNSFRLLTTRRMAVVPGATTPLTGGLAIALKEVGTDSLTVVVNRGKRRLLETKVKLLPGKPVMFVLDGYPTEGDGTMVVVLSLKSVGARQ